MDIEVTIDFHKNLLLRPYVVSFTLRKETLNHTRVTQFMSCVQYKGNYTHDHYHIYVSSDHITFSSLR